MFVQYFYRSCRQLDRHSHSRNLHRGGNKPGIFQGRPPDRKIAVKVEQQKSGSGARTRSRGGEQSQLGRGARDPAGIQAELRVCCRAGPTMGHRDWPLKENATGKLVGFDERWWTTWLTSLIKSVLRAVELQSATRECE